MYKFRNVIFQDIDLKIEDGLNDWSGICKECVSKYKVDSSLLDDFGYGCCMVEGCENEADHYIDFPEGEIQEISE